jgi:type II secretory pathway pseudopilin PulG
MTALSNRPRSPEAGFMMAALLVMMAVMAIMMTAMLPAYRTLAQREKEAELVFRGEQYARAVALFQRKFASAYPPSIDVLVEQKFLRKKYKDPITNDDFQVVMAGQDTTQKPPPRGGGPNVIRAGVAGVMSKSTETAFRVYNGRTKYNEWVFVAVQATNKPNPPPPPPPPPPK